MLLSTRNVSVLRKRYQDIKDIFDLVTEWFCIELIEYYLLGFFVNKKKLGK
jgi:hypothetical protein